MLVDQVDQFSLEGLFEFFPDIYNIFPEGVFSFNLSSIQSM